MYQNDVYVYIYIYIYIVLMHSLFYIWIQHVRHGFSKDPKQTFHTNNNENIKALYIYIYTYIYTWVKVFSLLTEFSHGSSNFLYHLYYKNSFSVSVQSRSFIVTFTLVYNIYHICVYLSDKYLTIPDVEISGGTHVVLLPKSNNRRKPSAVRHLDKNDLTTHYNDVRMGTMAYQITSLTIVSPTGYSGADQRKHQSSGLLAFVRAIHRWPVNSPHKGPVTRKTFPFDDVIMISDRCEFWYICSPVL